MAAPLTFTLDLEDHRPDASAPLRFPDVTRRLLDRLAEWEVVGTFFVVGRVAESEPDLVRAVAAAGHEVALHGWEHVPLTQLDPERVRKDLHRGKALLEDLAGHEVVGFRAPVFSLTPATTWVTDLLTDEGFRYSSSVLPARNPLFGFPGAPRHPFRWPSGLVEFPVPVASVGAAAVPYLGGTYLRLLPDALIGVLHRRSTMPVPWLYLHPYDVDTDERFWMVPEAGWMSPLLWVGRDRVVPKVERLLCEGPAGPPLGDRLDEVAADARFEPGRGAEVPAVPVAPVALEGSPMPDELTQDTMVHRLPRAPLVDRLDFLVDQARGKRVIHIGFVDTGFRAMQDRAGTWLHGRLHDAAEHLVGIDVNEPGVEDARASGFEAYAVDCRDAAAVAALGIEPAELVIAGEVIEHVDDPGAFLAGLHALVAPGGRLIVTTPNCLGWFNVFSVLANREINHPDHVVMFSWRALTTLAGRYGWEPLATHVYVPSVKEMAGSGVAAKALTLAGRAAVGIERSMARLGRPFVADGMIVTFRRS